MAHTARGRVVNPRAPTPSEPRSLRGLWIIGTVVVVVGFALVIALATGSKKTSGARPAPAKVLHQVTAVPAATFATVGRGSAVGGPQAVSAPPLTLDGKPEILYVGAEYCPYCATERWPMVIALSRFGTFTKLKTTHSSSTDVFPNTATFSFHKALFTSKYLAFTGVELTTNQRQGDGYAPLDKLTAAQQNLFMTYTAPPYGTKAGGIPFVDFGGRFLVNGVGYDPSVLSGIAGELHDPTTAVSKGAVGVANLITAAICSLTHDQPAPVCTTPVIRGLETSPAK
jgi:hypothetical protein